jgi:hypothetical protein
VKFPDYIPRDQIGKYKEAANAYIPTSRFERLPLVILVAIQPRTPVSAREADDVGFVLENMVTTEEEMSSRLIKRNWNELWRNMTFFTPEYQRREITSLVEDFVP